MSGYGGGAYGAGGYGSAVPDLAYVKVYLSSQQSTAADAEVLSALSAEIDAQAHACRIPEAFPSDLAEALCRRVAHNLALRGLPIGVQATTTNAASQSNVVAGYDAEVRRFEAPYRKLVLG